MASKKPEHQAPPEIFYNEDEAAKYTNNTRITTTESMENMVITITMTVLVQPRKENMNKLPNIAKMVIEGQSLGLI